MPNRILKESVCTSPNIERLSWFEEVCFYRLIVQCDDYGRLDARPVLLRAKLFPLREDVSAAAVDEAISALEEAGLVARYEANDQPYLHVLSWDRHQRIRSKRSRFPAPIWDETAYFEGD